MTSPAYDMGDIASDATEVATTNRTLYKYDDLIVLPGVRYSLIVVHITCSVFAVLGNGLVLLVVYRRRALRRNQTVIFIVNLALCDLIQCAFYRPLQLADLFLPFGMDYKYSFEYCRTMAFFQCLFSAVGFHTIVAISQERLFLIVYPLRAKHCCSVGRARRFLVVLWLISVACMLPVPLKFARIIKADVGDTRVRYCGVFSKSASGAVFFSAVLLIYFIIPCIVLCVSYSRIFFALYHRPRDVPTVHEVKDVKSLRARRSLAKMMMAVAVIFVLCWGPHFIFYSYAGLGGPVPRNGFFIATVMDVLPIVSSCLNPFIYTINSRTFRQGLSSLLRPQLRRKSYTDSTMNNTFAGNYLRQQSVLYERTDTFSGDRKISLIGARAKGDVMM